MVYTAVYEHDGSMWFVRVEGVEGCHSQGRTIAEARERIREALGLCAPGADLAQLNEEIRARGPMTWNHRVMKHVEPTGEVWFGIHEVHYDDAGNPVGWTEASKAPFVTSSRPTLRA